MKYMKTDIKFVDFTDESTATLDGPDGWSEGCDEECPKGMRRQHGVGGLRIGVESLEMYSLIFEIRVSDCLTFAPRQQRNFSSHLDLRIKPKWI